MDIQERFEPISILIFCTNKQVLVSECFPLEEIISDVFIRVRSVEDFVKVKSNLHKNTLVLLDGDLNQLQPYEKEEFFVFETKYQGQGISPEEQSELRKAFALCGILVV